MGKKRIRAPGIKIMDLPDIDIILISHDHYDHLDITSLQQLNETHQPVILAGLGVKNRLESLGGEREIGRASCRERGWDAGGAGRSNR